MIDATFWVAVSFVIFVFLLIYFKIPSKIKDGLNESIFLIKKQIEDAEKLRDEANNILSDSEKKLSNSKKEIQNMITEANKASEKMIIKTNSDFHKLMDNRKKDAERKIFQMKEQVKNDIKNASVKIAIESVSDLLKNSIDKSKLDKILKESIEETKLALKEKSS